MEAVITALQDSVNPTDLWAVVATIVPIVGVLIVFSLGLHFARKTVKGASKGKARF